jgi:hypothetical protein
MRWASIAIALTATSSRAAAKPTLGAPTSELWGPTLISEILEEDGFVALALTENECVGCVELNRVARKIDRVDAPGRWHVHVVFAEGYVVDAHEVLPGSRLPVLVLARHGHVLAARDAFASVDEAEAWLAASARRTAHIAGGPLACTSRMVDLLVAPGRLGASDLIRFADLRTSGRTPRGDDPLVTAWGVLASFTVIDRHHEIELGDLIVDAQRVLLVDLPTHAALDVAHGTLVDDSSTTRGTIKITGDLVVLRPIAGTFCRGG